MVRHIKLYTPRYRYILTYSYSLAGSRTDARTNDHLCLSVSCKASHSFHSFIQAAAHPQHPPTRTRTYTSEAVAWQRRALPRRRAPHFALSRRGASDCGSPHLARRPLAHATHRPEWIDREQVPPRRPRRRRSCGRGPCELRSSPLGPGPAASRRGGPRTGGWRPKSGSWRRFAARLARAAHRIAPAMPRRRVSARRPRFTTWHAAGARPLWRPSSHATCPKAGRRITAVHHGSTCRSNDVSRVLTSPQPRAVSASALLLVSHLKYS